MTISSADRRAADYVGHIVRMPDGRWTGCIRDRAGSTLVLQGVLMHRAGAEGLELVATFGETPDQQRLRREARR